MTEFSEKDGLRVEFDEESNTFSFIWDSETHPEWDFLKDITSESFSQILLDQINRLDGNQEETGLQSGGSSGGTPEVVDHSVHPE
jgi:hypothetical protein